jgi:hypothetical protein
VVRAWAPRFDALADSATARVADHQERVADWARRGVSIAEPRPFAFDGPRSRNGTVEDRLHAWEDAVDAWLRKLEHTAPPVPVWARTIRCPEGVLPMPIHTGYRALRSGCGWRLVRDVPVRRPSRTTTTTAAGSTEQQSPPVSRTPATRALAPIPSGSRAPVKRAPARD